MIRIDRAVARAVLKLSKKSYSAALLYDPSQGILFLMDGLHDVRDSVRLKLSPDEVTRSIGRLMDRGYFEKTRSFNGGFTFSVTPLLRHRFAFWADSFTKKFWGGFFTGVAVSVTANLLTGYVQQLFAAGLQWLRHLL